MIAETVDRLIQLHESRGVSSDVAWAIAFCIQHGVKLSRRSAKSLSRLEDDTVAIQVLQAHSMGLVPGFSATPMTEDLKSASCEGVHWLLLYESVRHGFIPSLKSVVAANALFDDLLLKDVTFYRKRLPPYATLVHSGGAPEWVVAAWLHMASGEPKTQAVAEQPVARMINGDMALLDIRGKASSDLVRELLDRVTAHTPPSLEPYE